jgi:hypothetical protein
MIINKLKITDSNTKEDVISGTFYTSKDIKTYNLKDCKSIDDMNSLISKYEKLNKDGQGRYVIRVFEGDK